MKYLIFIAPFVFYSVIGLEVSNRTSKPPESYCFHFSWLGSTYEEEQEKNCSSDLYKDIPCIKPFEISQTNPNYTEIWGRSKSESFTCLLQPQLSCIKYTYRYDGAVVNSSHFCGKLIADIVNPIHSGCYTQKIRGYDVEACACESTSFGMPCNSSIRNTCSLLGIVLIILFSVFF